MFFCSFEESAVNTVTLLSLFEKFLVIAVLKIANKPVFILLLTVKGLAKIDSWD